MHSFFNPLFLYYFNSIEEVLNRSGRFIGGWSWDRHQYLRRLNKMKDKFEIKNCFEFVCPLKWDNLEKTDNNDIRFCGSCEKQVFKASDLDSFSRLANENKCVAYIENEGVPTIMGETIPPTLNNDLFD